MISGSEPRGQRALTYGLLGALVVVVVGSLAGEAASYKGWLEGDALSVDWRQGWEYLDLGRLWQVLLVIGLVLWCVILFRGLRGKFSTESRGNIPYLFFYSAVNSSVLRSGITVPLQDRLRHCRFLAVLGRASLGRGLHGAVYNDHGGIHLRIAGRRIGEDGYARRLLGYPSLLNGRCRGDNASFVLQWNTGRAHGAGRFFLSRGSHPVDVLDRRGLDIPSVGVTAASRFECNPVPASLGSSVSRVRRFLEFSRCWRFRLSHQSSTRELLRNWHAVDRQP